MSTGKLFGAYFDYAAELILLTILIYRMDGKTPSAISRWRRVLAVCCLMAVFPVFYPGVPPLNQYIRVSYRICCYWGAFSLGKGYSASLSLYSAMLLATLVTAAAPLLFLLPKGKTAAGMFICFCMKDILYAVFLGLFFRIFPFRLSSKGRQIRWISVVAALVCTTFSKETFSAFIKVGTEPRQLALISVYRALVSVFVLIFLILMERNLRSIDELESSMIENAENSYRLKNLMLKRASEENIRRLNHDMKNHLQVLERLSQGSEQSAVHSYIMSMMGQLVTPERCFYTGSEILDGLLSIKAAEAERAEVVFSAMIRLSDGISLGEMDLCTLFGNALDNAIEASRKIERKDERFVHLRSEERAGFMFVIITNSYSGRLRQADGRLLSTKESSEIHGLGLTNISRAAKRCGGSMTMDVQTPGIFRLTILLPLNGKAEEAGGENGN